MQDRPKNPIGETVIILLIVGFGEAGDDVGYVAVVNGRDRDILVGRDHSAPAEPDTALTFEQRAQRHSETAHLIAGVVAGNYHAIGYDDEARQDGFPPLADVNETVLAAPP